MMKKIFIPLLAILFFAPLCCLDTEGRWAGGRCRAVPAETVAFACIPDLPRPPRDGQTTLAKIGAEPEVQAFLERPLQYLTSDHGGNEAAGILWKLSRAHL